MSAINWQQLAKALDDPETIEEAIARLIAAHNNDVTAHLGENQSLNSHRASEIIDHLALSIVNDKLEEGAISEDKLLLSKTSYQTNFEIITPFEQVHNDGFINAGIGGMTIGSGESVNNYGQVRGNPSGFSIWASSKNPTLSFIAAFEFDYEVESYLVLGRLGHICCGFKFVDGACYCYAREFNGTVHTLAVSGIEMPRYNTYKIKVISGDKLQFYINNELVGEFENITLSDMFSMCDFKIQNTGSENKSLRVTNLLFYQDMDWF